MRRVRVALFAILLSLVMALGTTSPTSATPSSSDAGVRATTVRSGAAAEDARRRWAPPKGWISSNPTGRNGRAILGRILRTVAATNKGHAIRIATWNFADRRSTLALMRAKKRGVQVQVITAGSTDSGPWKRLDRFLDRNRKDGSWAKKCRGACRSNGYAMHMKFALFSKVNRTRHVSMVGSWNLTRAAGERQWNDNTTLHDRGLYRRYLRTFRQLARDRNVGGHPTTYRVGRATLQMWPVYRGNPIARHLRPVDCITGSGRTRIRIAIAGWFDRWGETIARVVRNKWNQGCNIRILTTLAGRGVNRILKNRSGRGPVPIQQLTICCSSDGVPSHYLHMKSISIDGGYGADQRAKVLLTGSPNWSTAASRADEMVLRVRRAGSMVKRHGRFVTNWYASATSRSGTGGREVDPRIRFRNDLPDWFELD